MRAAGTFFILNALLWGGLGVACAKHKRHRVMPMEATAYARDTHATAAGTEPHEGIVAADPTVLPLGTRIRVTGTRDYDGNSW